MKIEVELVLRMLSYSSQKHTQNRLNTKTLYTTQLCHTPDRTNAQRGRGGRGRGRGRGRGGRASRRISEEAIQ